MKKKNKGSVSRGRVEEQRSEDALKESEGRYRELLENINDAFYVLGPEGKVLSISPVVEKITGYLPSEIIGKDFSRFVYADDLEGVRRAFEKDREGGKSIPAEFRYISKSGEVRWARAVDYSQFRDGKLYEVHGLLSDITDRKRAEESVRSLEVTDRALINALNEFAMMIDAKGKVLALNEIAARDLGKSSAQIIGTCAYDYLPEKLARMRRERIESVVKMGCPSVFEDERDGRFFENHLYPIFDGAGKVIRVAIHASDVTERKQTDHMLRVQRDLGLILSSASTVNDALDFFLRTLVGVGGIDCGGFYLLNRENGGFEMVHHLGLKQAFVESVKFYGRDSWNAKAARKGSSVYGNYTELLKQSEGPNAKNPEGVKAVAILPLKYEGEVIALLNVGSHSVEEFSEKTRTLLETVSGVLGNAVVRMKSQEDLLHEKKKQQDIIEFLPDATLVVDTDKKVIAWNKAMEKMTGVKKEEILGMGDYAYAIPFYGGPRPILVDLVTEWTDEMAKKYDQIKMTDGTLVAETYTPMTYGGRGATLLGTASILYDSQGKVIGAIESIRDVSETRAAQTLLQQERQRLDMVTKNIGAGLVMVSSDYHILWANDVFKGIYGGIESGFCSARFRMDGKVCANCPMKEVFEGGKESAGCEQSEIDMHGRVVWVQIIATPIRNPKGEVVAGLEMIIPITEKKNLEQEKELMQRQLIQSEKLASLGEISAGIAHELNTPLNVILGYLEIMKKKMGPAGQFNDHISCSLEEVEHCRQLINDFMSYAKPPYPNELKGAALQLNDVVNDSLRILHIYKGANIEVKKEFDPDLPNIVGEKKGLMQVFINLINNAVQSMPDGGTLTIRTRHLKEKGAVEFRVEDSGRGIHKDHLGKIFDPFFTTKRPGKGTGLGLSIVLRIMENHRGRIAVLSEEGKGSVFVGEIPVGGQMRFSDLEEDRRI